MSRKCEKISKEIGDLGGGADKRKRDQTGKKLLPHEMTIEFDMFRTFMED